MIIIASYSNVSVTYTADGTQTVFSFPFDYLRKAFVYVEINGETTLEQGTDFTVYEKTIVFTAAPAADTVVKIYRQTDTTPLVSWADASVLRAKDMTIQQIQVLHILEEDQEWIHENTINKTDEKWDAGNAVIGNVGNPENPDDAATKEYIDETFEYVKGKIDDLDSAVEVAGEAKDAAEDAADRAEAALDEIKEKASWYDNVADMRTAEGLQIGMVAGTKGYHAPNDGGNSFYIIREKDSSTDVDDGGSLIFLDNGNVAELVKEEYVSVKQFGAKGDGVTDDTNAFRNAFLMQKLYIPAGNYVISDYLIGTNEVKDEGAYVNLKPIFKTKNVLKNIEQFACQHDFVPTGTENMYGECMTYDTKRQKIILSFYWYTSPAKNVFLVLNKDTYAVEQTIDAPYSYAFNALSYNATNDTIVASGGNTAYIFDAGDLTSYTTVTLPNSCGHYAHDNVTGVDVAVNRTPDMSFEIYVYTNNLGTLLKTIVTESIVKDTAVQDCCAYNGKLYLMTWLSLFEIDLATETINEISIGSFNEFEGCEFIDSIFTIFLHQFGGNNMESIYQYMKDGTPQFYDRLPSNNIKKCLDVSLNDLRAMGEYYVNSTDTTGKNYPTGETKGYLIVKTMNIVADYAFDIIQEFHSLTSPFNVYTRTIIRSESLVTTISDWTLVEQLNSNTNNYIRYESGLQICWGNTYGSGTSSYKTVTFPVPFKDDNIGVSVVSGSVTSTTNQISFQVSVSSGTSFSFVMSIGSAWSDGLARWVAVGFWK